MQDRDYNKMMDQGWDKMKIILDNEMPVKKRRGTLLLLFFLFGVMTVGAYFIHLEWKENAERSIENEKTLLVDETTGGKDKSLDSSDLVSGPSSEASILKSSTDQTHKVTEEQLIQDPVVAKNDLPTLPGKDEVAKENEEEVYVARNSQFLPSENKDNISDNKDESVINQSRALEQMKKDIVSVDLSIDKVSAEQETNLSLTEKGAQPNDLTHKANLRIKSLEKLLLSSLSSSEHEKWNLSILVNESKMPLELIIEAGGALTGFNKLNGYYAGMLISKPIHRRFSISTGVRYQSLSSNLSLALSRDIALEANAESDPNLISNDVSEFFDAELVDGQVEYSVKAERYNEVYSSIRRLNVLTIPLNMEYKITPKHTIGAGLHYNRILSLSGDQSGNGLGFFQGANDLAFTNYEVIARRNIFSMSTSYRYAITRNFGFTTSLNAGLTGIIRSNNNNPGFQNTLSYVGFGLDYRL